MTVLPCKRRGYAQSKENLDYIHEVGRDPAEMIQRFADVRHVNPFIDPNSIVRIKNQGSQGSCQGHALSTVFEICYWLATGRVKVFSAACGYYLSQEKDGIRGDRGSTLSGGAWVATEHGMCLEEDWPYPPKYNPRAPRGIKAKCSFKLAISTPTSDPGLVRDAINLGLPVQDGIKWNSTVSRTRSTNYSGKSGGGHSTVLWTKQKNEDVNRLNSWGYRWNKDGINQNSPRSIDQQVRYRSNSHVIYAPGHMIYPDFFDEVEF